MPHNKNNRFEQYLQGNNEIDSDNREYEKISDDSDNTYAVNEDSYDEQYSSYDTSEYEKNVASGSSANSFLIRFVSSIVLVILALAVVWYFFGYFDGTGLYRKNSKKCNVYTAIDLFQKGRYVDSYDCFTGRYSQLTPMEKEYREVAYRMASFFRFEKNYRKYRIYFKWPSEFNISEEEKKKGYGLPDFVKSEIYEMVTTRYDEDGDGRESMDDPKEIASICLKMCGDYKDSRKRYQRVLKSRVTDLINKKDYKEANNLLNAITDKQAVDDFKKKMNQDKYETAKNKLALGDLNNARKELKKLAESGIAESKEILGQVDFNFMCMMGINTSTIKTKPRLYTEAAKELASARDSAIDYFIKEQGIQKEEVFNFCRKKLNELADTAYEKEDYQSAYNYYSAALKCSPYNPRVLECAQKLAGLPRKVGSIILLGHYEQDGIAENGPEPIEWIVTAISDDKALLLSKYVLAAKQMNMAVGERQEWKNSELRKWLNESFYNTAFDSEEKKELLQIEISSKDYRNRSISGMGQFENPFLYKLLGARNYSPSEGILDYVVCPNLDDLSMLEDRLELVAYATPDINKPGHYLGFNKFYPENCFGLPNSSASFKGIFFSFGKKKDNIKEPLPEKASDSKKIKPEDMVKCFGPCAYWLRNWSQSSKHGTMFRLIDEYGFENSEYASSKRIGVRPEIMIRLSQEEAVKREKDSIEKVENSVNKLKALKKLGEELKKKGFVEESEFFDY